MAIFIKSVGCDCPDCGPDPCTSGCVCDFSSGVVSGTTNADDVYDVTGQFIISKIVAFQGGTAESTRTQFELYADSVLVYDTGCLSGNDTFNTTVAIDAGTTELEVVVTQDCASPSVSGAWFYELECTGS